MKPIILFRKGTDAESKEELEVAEKYMPVIHSRIFPDNQLVIGRYSVLPFYQELETDLKFNNCRLINSWKQHRWIANFEYYDALQKYTPVTWTEENWRHCKYEGPFVVKGRTNSRKHYWNTHMFAHNKDGANLIARELRHDSLIGEQEIIYRQYVPLRTYEIGLSGLPFANEWRFFYLGTMRLSYGYYWSIADNLDLPTIDEEGLALADEVAQIAAKHVNFFVIDIAEKRDGGWILIELNDGQMSGLSENNPHELYSNLACALGTDGVKNVDTGGAGVAQR